MPKENHYQKCTEVLRATENQNFAHSAILQITHLGPAVAIVLANIPLLHVTKTGACSFV
jgi:hypothetical protein